MVVVGPHATTVPQYSNKTRKGSELKRENHPFGFSILVLAPPARFPMEDFQRSRSYANGQMMQIESYYGAPNRCYSASYAQTQIPPRDLKLKKGKSISAASSFSKSWTLSDPELQRKKRVASYKMYSVEGKIKGSFRKSFRWLKNKYSQVVYGW
ncbi:hypothetical protein LR48_Vigan04g234600 [Vigna angularis]|uniref:Uncharacterized protein n=2 Tax=Phaseolus angularis TaxID=3914 RepID=A0A0L9UHB2_PHAAN|nr:uncharacterized protein LOC108331098 [Vigna angularis]KAG2400431.1 uncharacterized protein HKW66_Vig0097150 [Vigna angularis]KOM42148.1 hypothetical protein LR48_Vigan04g234600 [Vigna angularis]BAT77995.1 hypothetical protein VIGAN_02061600 [Vigna angularis var. angularis]